MFQIYKHCENRKLFNNYLNNNYYLRSYKHTIIQYTTLMHLTHIPTATFNKKYAPITMMSDTLKDWERAKNLVVELDAMSCLHTHHTQTNTNKEDRKTQGVPVSQLCVWIDH